jgi:hypothetical protein
MKVVEVTDENSDAVDELHIKSFVFIELKKD